ncbi:MAG: M48 family metallopeptidase [Gemmatimonadaceae bacterium]
MNRSGSVALTALLTLACTPSLEEEQALGERYAREVETQVTVSRDVALDAYVDSLGAAIVAVADTLERNWHFSVIEADDLNAFALPGGHIYVNRGLVARAGSMSELAGVLGHEIGHVVQRHASEQLAARTKTNVAVTLFCSLTGWCSSDAAQVAINVGGAALFAKYSRADETEADSVAVEYLRRAGVDPRGVTEMFSRIARERASRPDLVAAILSSHPLDEQRIRRTRTLTAQWTDTQLDHLRRDDPGFDRVRPSP